MNRKITYLEKFGKIITQIFLPNCEYIEKFGSVGIIYKYTKFCFLICLFKLLSITLS